MKKIKKLLFAGMAAALLMVIQLPVSAQSDNGINWVSLEKAEALNKENPRKLFVDFYTDWCGWCKRMDATTFSHPVIVDYINKNYYAVKFNAEQAQPVTFRGMEFKNENAGQRRSAHGFAIAVLQGRLGYPTVAFFNENFDLITALPGFRPPEGLEPILVFFNEDHYKRTGDLDAFVNNFKGSVK